MQGTCISSIHREGCEYPPRGLLPLPGESVEADPGCDLWTEIFNAALLINPAFNIYRIFDMVSISLPSIAPRMS